MKKILFLLILLSFTITLFSCSKEGTSIYYYTRVKSKYAVSIEYVYYEIQINPKVGDEDKFIYLTDDIANQFQEIYFESECRDPNWLNVVYIKTNLGDKLVFYIDSIKKNADPDLAVMMIDYPFEYTYDEMMDFLRLSDFEVDFSDGSESWNILAQSYYQIDTLGCGLVDYTYDNHSIDYYPFDAANINPDEFVWVFTLISNNARAYSKSQDNTSVWITIPILVYRIWIDDHQIYITKVTKDTPEIYVYPFERPVIDNQDT